MPACGIFVVLKECRVGDGVNVKTRLFEPLQLFRIQPQLPRGRW